MKHRIIYFSCDRLTILSPVLTQHACSNSISSVFRDLLIKVDLTVLHLWHKFFPSFSGQKLLFGRFKFFGGQKALMLELGQLANFVR